MSPRLLLLAERFPPDLGGVARSAARLAGALTRLGVEVDVLAWTKTLPPGALESGPAGEVAAAATGAVLHRVGLYAHLDLSLQHTLNALEVLGRERGYAAVWGHYLQPAGFLAVVFAASSGLPATVSARGNDVDRLMFPPGDFARLRWTLERADVVSAVSHDLARKLGVLLGRDPAAVEVLGNAVDAELFAPAPAPAGLRERLGIAPDEAVLGFSGELRHKKGAHFLLDALSAVRRARPACLLVIGEARPREQELLSQFRAEAPEDGARVLVTGRLDDPRDVAEHLRLLDLFLLPSVWEGLPNALLEAMAAERPVLTSDAGGIPEVIEPGTSGYVVPRHELARLGEAALEVLGLPDATRAALGRAARTRVQQAFSPETEAAALSRVLARLGLRTV